MRKEAPFFLLLAGLICSFSACTSGISTDYKRQLETVLNQSSRADSLRLLLHKTPHDEQEAMAYLIAWMPQGDRDTMNLDLLKENVAYACRVRSEFSWTKALPDSIFLNEVLPYAVVDETRDSWRQDFYNRFAPRVAKCTDIRAAIDTINRIIPEVVGVEYNTLREKTNQSSAESIRQGMASCTGLSILLVDAFRSVGIPTRFAGTAAWHDNRGNHSWTEVWIDGTWFSTEYYQPPALDKAWFMADAGKSVSGDHTHGIYAVSFRPTGDWFPMAWNEDARSVHGIDVSQRYRDIYSESTQILTKQGTHTNVTFMMFRDKQHSSDSGDRVEANVDVFCNDIQVGGGRTAGPLQDMNDALSFLLEKGNTYTFTYENSRGEKTTVEVLVGNDPMTVKGYMQ